MFLYLLVSKTIKWIYKKEKASYFGQISEIPTNFHIKRMMHKAPRHQRKPLVIIKVVLVARYNMNKKYKLCSKRM